MFSLLIEPNVMFVLLNETTWAPTVMFSLLNETTVMFSLLYESNVMFVLLHVPNVMFTLLHEPNVMFCTTDCVKTHVCTKECIKCHVTGNNCEEPISTKTMSGKEQADEDIFVSGLLSEEEPSDDETPREGPSAVIMQGASHAHVQESKKKLTADRRRKLDSDAQAMNAAAEQEAAEAGTLKPRTLRRLNRVDTVIEAKQQFSCREELLVRVAEDCEKARKFFSVRGDSRTTAGRGMMQHRYVTCVCRDDEKCAYLVKGSWFSDGTRDLSAGWEVEAYSSHTCQGPEQPARARFATSPDMTRGIAHRKGLGRHMVPSCIVVGLKFQ